MILLHTRAPGDHRFTSSICFARRERPCLRDAELTFAAELRESGRLSFDPASALARNLLNADLGCFDEPQSDVSPGQAADIRRLLLTRFDEDGQSHPSFDLISGFLLP